MTPPEAPEDGMNQPGDMPPAASVCAPETLTVLTKRSDFLKAARARRQSTPAFTLQIREREEGEASGIRVGFTCSKKVGNAVARNHAKRRLREIANLVLPTHGKDGFDYVLIGRKDETSSRDFNALQEDLRQALTKAHP